MEKDDEICQICGLIAKTDLMNENRMKGYYCSSCGDYVISLRAYHKLVGSASPKELRQYTVDDVKTALLCYLSSKECSCLEKMDSNGK
ncbi:hypothetical protein [Anaerovibrio sp. JC8]|uniref:hypothetical protein n=1 Tax=Anaerovibrio sp. JC8 TaxID=1240085 RepID=UPI000A10A1FC|nr:hypothetical protein [Anaerovibrio sp. JC8]